MAQEVRQKRDIPDRRSKCSRLRPLQPLLCLQHVHWVTMRPVRGSSYTKNEYNLFYRKLNAEYFFIQQFFFEKSSIFWENGKKLFWWQIWQFFRERRRLARKINITFFITSEVLNILLFNNFSKKCCIFWENSKKLFLDHESLLKGRFWAATKLF